MYAAITEFVATGEPVGSRTLAKKSGLDLSPATIRNVLSDLEEGGYLKQPHTSAGRIPTDRAFRLFIDALMEVQTLSNDEHARIRSRFDELTPGQNVMRETGRLLAELTGNAAVIIAPRAEALTLKQLRFIRTKPGELLAVLVMSNGTVQNRFISSDVADSELERIHNLLDDVAEGRTLGDLREFFARKLATERVQHDELRRRAFVLGGAVVKSASETGADVVIEGEAGLYGQPEFSDANGTASSNCSTPRSPQTGRRSSSEAKLANWAADSSRWSVHPTRITDGWPDRSPSSAPRAWIIRRSSRSSPRPPAR